MWQYSEVRKKAWSALSDRGAVNVMIATLIYFCLSLSPIVVFYISSVFFSVDFAIFKGISGGYHTYNNFLESPYLLLGIYLMVIIVWGAITIITAPVLTVGLSRYLMNAVQKSSDDSLGVIVSPLKKGKFRYYFSRMLIKSLILTGWSIAIFALGSLPALIGNVSELFPQALFDQFGEVAEISMIYSLAFLSLVCPFVISFWLIRCLYAYKYTEFIVAEYDELKMNQAVHLSVQLTHAIKFRLFALDVTFLGWNLLNCLTLGLLTYWIVPYKRAAHYKVYCFQKAQYPRLFDGMISSSQNEFENQSVEPIESDSKIIP